MNASMIGVLVCLAFSAMFSAVETAFTSLTMFQIESLKKRKRGGRLVERLAKKPDELISTILIGNNVVNILASVLTTEWAMERWGDAALSAVTGGLTFVILIFGEVTPKRLAIAHNEFIASFLAPLILVCTVLFKPFVVVVNALSSLVTRLFGKPQKNELSIETMTQMLSIAEHMGIIDYAKSSMVKNVFRLGTTTVQAVMTHRIDVFSLDRRTSSEEACRLVLEPGHSRFPVYDGEPENIVGLVATRAAVNEALSGRGERPLSEIMSEPLYVLPNKPLGELFALFRERRETFAVVLDEYGGLAGVVTMRDVVEEIVGEIYEGAGEEPRERIRKRADGSYTVSGDTPISILAELSGAEPPNLPYVQTVAGYIAWALERIPVPGDQVSTPMGTFTVLNTQANRVEECVYRTPRSA
ncbi:MAG: HlyC/CorC family transporter [Spirochaetales bacterium]|nr:HlyC/CorC family transporter [Spirochaetales bacterium]MBP7264388.1 HlyC/CorC family transporter [Spirochaetia bacterium]